MAVVKKADIGLVTKVNLFYNASIMPDVVRANTNVTTMMIAERVADFIKTGN